jgi:hypothetical protein
MTSQRSTGHLQQVVGTFQSQQAAEAAQQALQGAKFSPEQLSLETQVIDPNPTMDQSQARKGAGGGATAGALFGLMVGLLLSIGGQSLPGLTPASIAQPPGFFIAVALLASGVGAAGGALIGAFSGLNAPATSQHGDRARLSHNYLLTVQGNETEVLKAEEILRQQGGQVQF